MAIPTRSSAAIESSQKPNIQIPDTPIATALPATAPPATALTAAATASFTPAAIQYNATLQERLVALEQRKLEAEIAAIEARTTRESKESRARIAALQAVTTTAAATAAPTSLANKEDFLDEIPPAALLVAHQFPGLPEDEIARIFTNKFRPRDLYKLRHLQGREEKDQEEKNLMKDGRMEIKRATGTLRDFGPSPAIWSESFLNYTSILVSFFGVASPTLTSVLLGFHDKIQKLGTTHFEWQNAVLPLALDFHTSITTGKHHTDVEAWADLPQTWIYQYCTPTRVLDAPGLGSKKRAAATCLDRPANKNFEAEETLETE